MNVIGFLLVLVAAICTLLYIPISATIRPLSGPDAMELAGLVFLSLARFLCLAAALTIAAARGGFPWIHSSHGVQWIAVFLLLAASAGMELWSLVAATSGWYGEGARPWVAVFAVVVPLILGLFAVAALSQGRLIPLGAMTLRAGAGAILLLMLTGVVVIGIRYRAGVQERREHVAALEQERARARNEKLAAFGALALASPLIDWLAYTSDSDDEIRDAAVRSIRERPRLHDELAQILRGDDPLPALRWLWLWTPSPSSALAQPVYDAAAGLPEWARGLYDDEDASNDSDVATACEALVVIADSFERPAIDFRGPFEKMRAFLDSRALPEEQMGSDKTYQARSMLQYWFDRHGTNAGGTPGREEVAP